MSDRQILVDVTTALRVGGQADGITRVIRELGRFASERANTGLVFFDSTRAEFRIIDRDWVNFVTEAKVIVDLPHFSNSGCAKPPKRGVLRWFSHPRKRLHMALDRFRMAGGLAGSLAGKAQFALMNEKYRNMFVTRDGGRLRYVSASEISSNPMILGDEDVVVLCGSDWPAMEYFLRSRKPGRGGRIVVLCHDIIPILYPQYFLRSTARMFNLCFAQVFRVADLVVFTTEAVRRDALSYCQRHGKGMRDSCVVRLASIESRRIDGCVQLPGDLESERYVLFVSTMEPRKGHDMLLSVWKRLIEVPACQEARFKMVFVGRKGWLVDDLFERLAQEPFVGKSLLVLTGVDDETLSCLYANAAFCVYPSVYEGFGLPVVESFNHGKAVIVSNGGALPEVVGDLAPCLDPGDETLWFDNIRAWIEHPEMRAPYETAIRAMPAARTWLNFGEEFFDAIERHLSAGCHSVERLPG